MQAQKTLTVSAKGFTLVEVMITIAIMSIILSIAVPSFRTLFESGDVDSELTELTSSIALLRSEALKTGKRTALCASNNGTSCLAGAGANWSTGYIGFVCNSFTTCTPPTSTASTDFILVNDSIQNHSIHAYDEDGNGLSQVNILADGTFPDSITFALCAKSNSNGNAKKLEYLPSGQAFTAELLVTSTTTIAHTCS